jgi:hypothetical protein
MMLNSKTSRGLDQPPRQQQNGSTIEAKAYARYAESAYGTVKTDNRSGHCEAGRLVKSESSVVD